MSALGGNLGKYLLAKGIVTQGQLAIALQDQALNKGQSLGGALMTRGFATHAQLEGAIMELSRRFESPRADRDELVSFTAARSLREIRGGQRPLRPWKGLKGLGEA